IECSYMASTVFDMGAAFGFFPPTEKSFTLLTATAGSLAGRMRGSDGPRAIARRADLSFPELPGPELPGSSCRARFSQPSSVTFTPGVPDSMKSCASKCEREGSGEPAACTMARCFWFQSGSNDAIDGCNPKKPSRSNTDFFGMLMVGRMA